MRRGRTTRKIIRSIKPKPLRMRTGRVAPKLRTPRRAYTKIKSYKI